MGGGTDWKLLSLQQNPTTLGLECVQYSEKFGILKLVLFLWVMRSMFFFYMVLVSTEMFVIVGSVK